MRRIAIAGVTGSIGAQTLKVLRSSPELYELVAISANSDFESLVAIAKEFRPRTIVFGDTDRISDLKELIPAAMIEPASEGFEALIDGADIVVNAVVGFAGLSVTLAALRAGKRVALANKESLVAGGVLVRDALTTNGAELIPIDSEHSAIFQCLQAGRSSEVHELVLTSSGGPFRGYSLADLQNVTPDQALAHPKWNMGKKISIDSSTMFNKALEMIEAHELFDVAYEQIRVVVHPEAVVHSAVTFNDGSTMAQMSPPDMRLPISYSLSFPERATTSLAEMNWNQSFSLNFEEPDRSVFKALDLAAAAGRAGGTAPAILNAANEVAVARFLAGELAWLEISEVVGDTLKAMKVEDVTDIAQLTSCDQEVRARADEVIRRNSR